MEIKQEKFEEYKNRVLSLQSNIVNAYYLYYYLFEIENIMKTMEHKKATIIFIPFYNFQHTIRYEFRRELILLVWKINIDTNKDSNTLSHLKNDIASNFLINKKRLNIKKAKNFNNLENKIGKIRNQIIAHTDKNIDENKININEVRNLLDSYFNYFNQLLFDDVLKDEKQYSAEIIHGECAAGVEQFYSGIVYDFLKEKKDEQ